MHRQVRTVGYQIAIWTSALGPGPILNLDIKNHIPIFITTHCNVGTTSMKTPRKGGFSGMKAIYTYSTVAVAARDEAMFSIPFANGADHEAKGPMRK